MNKLTVQGVRVYIDENGTAQLNLEDAARGLGFVTVATSGNECVRWSRVMKYLGVFNFHIKYKKEWPEIFIPENIFYRLAMKAKNEDAEKFQAKVADEILPSIRRNGFYGATRIASPKLTPDQALEIARIIRTTDRTRLSIIKDILSYAGINIEFQAPNNINSHIMDYLESTNLQGDIKAAAVYSDYLHWCENEGHVPVSLTLFGRRIAACGISRRRRSEARYYSLQKA